MKKPKYAVAMELRKSDKELDDKFNSLDESLKWQWLAYATKNEPYNSLNYAKELVSK